MVLGFRGLGFRVDVEELLKPRFSGFLPGIVQCGKTTSIIDLGVILLRFPIGSRTVPE